MKEFNTLVFIDDDEPTNYYHRIIVEEANICETSIFFHSPLKALDYFRSLSLEEAPQIPDAIFLDINMPMIDGWEFLALYKGLNLQPSPIIIMLTTSLLYQDMQRAEAMELVYKTIKKPLEVETLATLHQELMMKSLSI